MVQATASASASPWSTHTAYDNRTFYFNGLTGELSWERPTTNDARPSVTSPEPSSSQTAEPSQETRMMQAAKAGNLHALMQFVDEGGNVNDVDSDGWTPLMLASAAGKKETVEYLLSIGTSVETTDIRRRSALHVAAAQGRSDICDLLIRSGCKPNQKDAQGYTALHHSAINSYPETCKFLLTKCSRDLKDNHGNTAYDLAGFSTKDKKDVEATRRVLQSGPSNTFIQLITGTGKPSPSR